MKKQFIILGILFTIIITCSIFLYKGMKNEEQERLKAFIELNDLTHTKMEEAYFEGQKDALEGDVRIEKDGDCYIWTKSCWDNSDRVVKYVPNCDSIK